MKRFVVAKKWFSQKSLQAEDKFRLPEWMPELGYLPSFAITDILHFQPGTVGTWFASYIIDCEMFGILADQLVHSP